MVLIMHVICWLLCCRLFEFVAYARVRLAVLQQLCCTADMVHVLGSLRCRQGCLQKLYWVFVLGQRYLAALMASVCAWRTYACMSHAISVVSVDESC